MKTGLWLPLLIVEIYVFALGLSLFLAAAFVKYRDVSYIWEVFMQAGFYLTPIIYPLSRITNLTFQKIIMLNPMAQAIQDARYAVITHQTTTTRTVFHDGWYTLVPFVIIIVVLFIGVSYFRRESKYFAENI